MGKATSHQINISTEDCWETPPLVLEETMIKYDIYPTLDVCATKQNTKFPKYFTSLQNGLTQEWDEDFFMNPPYSEINQWMQKSWEQHTKYNVNALILVFAKTSVRWWHEFVEGKGEVHFQKGRIRFLLNGVEPRNCKDCKRRSIVNSQYCPICKRKISKSSPTYDSAWIIFRKEKK